MINKILKKINYGLATLSVTTMVFIPVAQGKQAQAEAERISQAQLEQFVQEFGLNKSMTVGEFYTKNKDQFPPRIQKMIEPLMTQFKNEPMPQFEVSQSKNSKGETIANLRLTGKDQLANIQFLGEKNKFVKFDNTNLSLEDVANFDDMFAKLYFGDASHRKGMGEALTSPKLLKNQKPTAKKVIPPPQFSGLPKITPELWKKLTPMERAQFMLNLRMLWSGAEDVLDAKENSKNSKSKGKKTSALDKWNSFFAMLDEAQAATNCVVAGYIGTYGTGKRCNYPNDAKTPGCNFPCNPTIYGFDEGGKKFCLSNATELQTATHYRKGCDGKMPLSSVAPTLPAANSKKDSSRYAGGILDSNKAIAANDPELIQNTKRYLDSMLQSNPEMRAAFKDGKITPALLEELQRIQTNFDNIISVARKQCAEAADQTQYDREFWGACDQLHGRFLFTAAYLEKAVGCKGGGKINESSLMCSCLNGPAVPPGAECAAAPAPQPSPAPTPDPGPQPDPNGSKCDKPCVAPQTCQNTATDGDGVENWECTGGGSTGGSDDGKTGGFWSKLWGGIKKVAPWVIGGVGLWLLYSKFLKPKKPALKPAADACPNGTIPPCGTTCTAPQAMLSSGVCGCAACPPGQTMTNASSCLCETTSTTTTLYICADGVTQVSDLANCPATANYTCWDGSKVANPINCPEQTSTGTGTSTNKTDTSR